jgi:hypothetical protein
MGHNKGAAWLGRQVARSHEGTRPPRHTTYKEGSDSQMKLQDVIAGIKANEHAKVLIVGVRGDNFPPRYQAHPQLVFWETDQAANATIPAAVRLICPTRFINHGLWSRLQNEASRRDIHLVHVQGTGEIKALLDPLIPSKAGEAEVEVSTPAATPAPPVEALHHQTVTGQQRVKIGVLDTFVTQHLRRDTVLPYQPRTRSGKIVAEAKRLLALAESQGIHSTIHSVEVVIRRVRGRWLKEEKQLDANLRRSEKQKANFEAKRTGLGLGINQPSIHAAAAAVNGVGAVKEVATQTLSIADDDRELLLMARDAIAALELIKGKLEDRAQKKARLFEALKDL